MQYKIERESAKKEREMSYRRARKRQSEGSLKPSVSARSECGGSGGNGSRKPLKA